jgi:pyruvate dehydrogenase (quinone)
MKTSGFLDAGVALQNPNFADMARAMGVVGIRVEDPGELDAALNAALRHEGPALVDCLTNRMELAMPPHTSIEQMKGFGIYMTKAVLNGRGDEVLQLAHTNLWR